MANRLELARQNVLRASLDDSIATMKVTEVMRKHGLRYESAVRAKELAVRRMKSSGRSDEIAEQVRRRKTERKHARLRGVESRYPNILSRIHSEGNNFAIARDFGVTREWVRVLRKTFRELADETGQADETLLCEVSAQPSGMVA